MEIRGTPGAPAPLPLGGPDEKNPEGQAVRMPSVPSPQPPEEARPIEPHAVSSRWGEVLGALVAKVAKGFSWIFSPMSVGERKQADDIQRLVARLEKALDDASRSPLLEGHSLSSQVSVVWSQLEGRKLEAEELAEAHSACRSLPEVIQAFATKVEDAKQKEAVANHRRGLRHELGKGKVSPERWELIKNAMMDLAKIDPELRAYADKSSLSDGDILCIMRRLYGYDRALAQHRFCCWTGKQVSNPWHPGYGSAAPGPMDGKNSLEEAIDLQALSSSKEPDHTFWIQLGKVPGQLADKIVRSVSWVLAPISEEEQRQAQQIQELDTDIQEALEDAEYEYKNETGRRQFLTILAILDQLKELKPQADKLAKAHAAFSALPEMIRADGREVESVREQFLFYQRSEELRAKIEGWKDRSPQNWAAIKRELVDLARTVPHMRAYADKPSLSDDDYLSLMRWVYSDCVPAQHFFCLWTGKTGLSDASSVAGMGGAQTVSSPQPVEDEFPFVELSLSSESEPEPVLPSRLTNTIASYVKRHLSPISVEEQRRVEPIRDLLLDMAIALSRARRARREDAQELDFIYFAVRGIGQQLEEKRPEIDKLVEAHAAFSSLQESVQQCEQKIGYVKEKAAIAKKIKDLQGKMGDLRSRLRAFSPMEISAIKGDMGDLARACKRMASLELLGESGYSQEWEAYEEMGAYADKPFLSRADVAYMVKWIAHYEGLSLENACYLLS